MEKLMHFNRLEPSDDSVLIQNRQNLESKKVLPPIDSFLNDQQRSLVIRKIFKNRKGDYLDFLKELEFMNSWNEALNKLDSEMNNRKIYSGSHAAVLLSNIVYRHYYPNDVNIVIE